MFGGAVEQARNTFFPVTCYGGVIDLLHRNSDAYLLGFGWSLGGLVSRLHCVLSRFLAMFIATTMWLEFVIARSFDRRCFVATSERWRRCLSVVCAGGFIGFLPMSGAARLVSSCCAPERCGQDEDARDFHCGQLRSFLALVTERHCRFCWKNRRPIFFSEN